MVVKAAFVKNMFDVVIRDVELPVVEQHEVRLKVDACGICGTDVTGALDGKPDHQPFGHEVAGTVLEVGGAVTRVKPGQRVALDSSSACGECDNCKNCRQELCTNVTSFFSKPHLGFAEEMLSPALSCVPYDRLTPEVACLAEPLGVAIDMHRLAEIGIGSHVVVSGVGAIGLMALRLAKLSGAERIYACSPSRSQAKIQTALKFGADEIIEIDKTDVATYKFPQPPDRFMITSPPSTIPPMIVAAAKGAIISYLGIRYGKGANIAFDANDFHFKKLQLRGSFASPAMYTPFALHMLEAGAIDGRALISHTFELKDIGQALRTIADQPDKVVKVVVANR